MREYDALFGRRCLICIGRIGDCRDDVLISFVAAEIHPFTARPASGGLTRGTFDVCHVGVVLRAVALVHGVLAVGCLLSVTGWDAWLFAWAAAAAVGLPGTLLWLLLLCFGQSLWSQATPVVQWVVALGLGALAGALGAWLMTWFVAGAAGGPVVLGCVLAGAGLAGVVFSWLWHRATLRRPADAQARLAELQSRIRPHFLFNTLNSAMALVQVDPARAEGMLEDLAALFRVALSESGAAVTLADEVDLAQRYLAIEQVRFGERLSVVWSLAPEAMSVAVPPLLLQPLVENAVVHGVEPIEAGGRIEVTAVARGAQVEITVSNTVPLSTSSRGREGHGMALANIRERLSLLHDVAADFDAGLQPTGVFRVRIVVPFVSSVPSVRYRFSDPTSEMAATPRVVKTWSIDEVPHRAAPLPQPWVKEV